MQAKSRYGAPDAQTAASTNGHSPATDGQPRPNDGVAASKNGNGAHPLRTGNICERLYYTSTRAPEFIDITDDVREVLARSEVQHGFVVVFSRHTTAAIRINEAEPLLIEDMECMLARIAPAGVYYRHNDLTIRTVNLTENEDLNGHSHCQHLLMGASEMVPCADGELMLGGWQRIFLVELDCAREREVIVQVVGSA
ncbi:MAG: YjbQ family protein [Dehalococcoidia bacterium]|nr:YjbQ family protein [Dehalococcoidia bacterium]